MGTFGRAYSRAARRASWQLIRDVPRERARAERSADNARDQVLAQQRSAFIAIGVAASRKQADLAESICDEIVLQRLSGTTLQRWMNNRLFSPTELRWPTDVMRRRTAEIESTLPRGSNQPQPAEAEGRTAARQGPTYKVLGHIRRRTALPSAAGTCTVPLRGMVTLRDDSGTVALGSCPVVTGPFTVPACRRWER